MLQYRRGKRKIIADYKSGNIYKFYKNKVKNPKDKKTFMRVLSKILPEIINFIIFENLEFYFPNRLGSLRIKKKLVEIKLTEEGKVDARALSPNWKKTKKLWMELYPNKTPGEIKAIKNKPLVRELNEHTDGYRFVWYWDRFTSNVPNQGVYILDLNRDYDRLITKASKTIINLDYYK